MEMMVAVAVGSIILSALASLTFYTSRSFAALSNYVDLDQASRNTLDHMSQEIRQSDRLTAFSSNSMSLLYNGETLTYTYDSSAKTLTRTLGSENRVLLTGCESLTFAIFQRNPVAGTYDQYPTASTATAKLVQLNWTCVRKILGQNVNSESVQSAKIVLRKQE
jgi:Tfp pilus assembly protein PilW